MKVEVAKAKQRVYDEFCARLDRRERDTDLYRLSRQRDRDGNYMQQGAAKVEVGLHDRSALSTFLFAVVKDSLTDEVRQECDL